MKKTIALLALVLLISVGCKITFKSDEVNNIADDLTAQVSDGVDQGVETAKEEVKEEIVKELTAKELAIANNSIEPESITVLKDEEIKIKVTNNGDKIYGFSLPDFDINGSVDPGDTRSFSFKADKIGTFTYSCNMNCDSNTKGSLIVK